MERGKGYTSGSDPHCLPIPLSRTLPRPAASTQCRAPIGPCASLRPIRSAIVAPVSRLSCRVPPHPLPPNRIVEAVAICPPNKKFALLNDYIYISFRFDLFQICLTHPPPPPRGGFPMKHSFLTQYAVRDSSGRFTGQYRLRFSFPSFRPVPSSVPPSLPNRPSVLIGCVSIQLCVLSLCAYLAS